MGKYMKARGWAKIRLIAVLFMGILEEASLRQVMFEQSKKRILLCDSSKIGKTCFYNMGNISELHGIISDIELPREIQEKFQPYWSDGIP